MEEITNEVIWERLNTFMSDNKEDHIRIEEQVRRTNGQVSSLSKWRSFTMGAVAILSAIIVPMALMYFSKLMVK